MIGPDATENDQAPADQNDPTPNDNGNIQIFIEKIPVPIAIMDRGMRYLAMSTHFLKEHRLPGPDARAMIGRSHPEMFDDHRERWRELQRRALEGDTQAFDEDVRRHADGSSDWIRWTMTPWRSVAGAINGTVLFTENISTRKQVEDSLAKSEERMRLAQRAASIGVFDSDFESGRVIWSDEQYKIFGVSPGAFPGTVDGVRQYMLASDREKVLATIGNATRQRSDTLDLSFRIRRPNGAIRHIQASCALSYRPDGQLSRMVGVNIDVTDRWRAEVALVGQKEAFRTAVGGASMDVALDVLSQSAMEQTDYVSRCVFFTINHEKAVLSPVGSMVASDADTAPLLRVAPDGLGCGLAAFSGQPVIVSDVTMIPDRASWRRVAEKLDFRALWSFPVETMGGQVIGVFALFFSQPQTPNDSDVAFNQILAQAAAIIIAHQLEKDDRSRAQDALRHSIKMEAIGLLTGGIAHDFNNMLQGVIMGMDVARQKMVSGRLADAMRYLQTARDAALRASGLSRRLLSLARRQQLEPRRIDPEELIRGMSDLLGRVLGPGIDIVLDLHGTGREVVCDPSELESSILNLCINSRDAMPEGGRLTIATDVSTIPAGDDRPGTQPAPGDYLGIRVEDTGKGMSPDVLERALEPFFTSKPPGDGTGLGLSQVQAFASQSGGFLRLDSAAGHGTVVRICLPVASTQPAREADAPDGEPSVEIAADVNLLLVDDETSVREPIAAWLRDIGYGVVEAVDGPTALRKLDEGFRPTVLVTDVGLAGGMDGRALAEEARRRCPGLPVIFITGFTRVPLPDDAPVLVKPFDLDALARLISGVLPGS